jgi:3-hydroxymyristoyl/3-hydroxydecanoyl-(acyl carrier protein) dehydratase
MAYYQSLDIANFLPHRPPFLMVDRILSIDENHVSTSFVIKPDDIFVSNNVFNEVGLIESAAQTCSAIVGKSFFEDSDTKGTGTKLIGFISAIKEVIIHGCPAVGDTIISKAKLKLSFDATYYRICTIECSIFVSKKELLSCEMNLFIQEISQ